MSKNSLRTRSFTLLIIATALLSALSTPAAHAATISVNTTADVFNPGDITTCSLREAIQAANTDTAVGGCAAGNGADTITLSKLEPTGTYTLTITDTSDLNMDSNAVNDLDIIGDLTIRGTGSFDITIRGTEFITDTTRIIDVQPGANVTLSNIVLSHGHTSLDGGAIQNHGTLTTSDVFIHDNSAGGDGGGIYNDHGTLVFEGTVSTNTAVGSGAGIANDDGTVTIGNTQINNNTATANGAGISNNSALTINHAWLHDNSTNGGSGGNLYNTQTASIDNSLIQQGIAQQDGGNVYSGIASGSSTLMISRTTISGGSTTSNGGGIYNDGALNLTNITISTNHANSGAGIYSVESAQPMSLVNATIVSNTASLVAGTGINNTGAAISLKNTLVAYNGTNTNCAGAITSLGYNLELGTSCNLVAAGDLNAAPKLGPFQDNGGVTFAFNGAAPTYALLIGSPAVNAGTNAGCPATDQRGIMRPHGVRCDIGAYETNNPPTASNDAYSTLEDTPLVVAAPGVQANDSDPDGDVLTTTLVLGPAHGTLVLNANGAFSYTPAAHSNGTDSFSYYDTDGTVSSANVTVNLTITAVNDPPIAGADTYSTPEDAPLTVAAPGVLANDSDVEGDALTANLVAGPTHGALVLNANGSFNYTPAAHYHGGDSFSYCANDGALCSANATVTIGVVAPNNSAPVAGDDIVSTSVNKALTISFAALLVNDHDSNGDPLTIIAVSSPSARGGIVTLSGSNVIYTPPANVDGVDSFTYTVSDDQNSTATGTVTVHIAKQMLSIPLIRR